jgi:hypothetical protein
VTAEDVALYMRLSEGQLRHWTCVSVENKCAHCDGDSNNELVGVTLNGGSFIIPVCAHCIVLTGVPRSMVLRDKLSPEAYVTIERLLVIPDRLCNECGERTSIWRMFSLGPEGYKCHFVCAQCSYRWNSKGEAALPNIMATMHCSGRVQ